MILEEWSRHLDSGFVSPEAPLDTVFVGKVFGHPQVADGTKIQLPRLKRYDPQENAFRTEEELIVRLRTPNPDYEARFPAARKLIENAAQAHKFRVEASNVPNTTGV